MKSKDKKPTLLPGPATPIVYVIESEGAFELFSPANGFLVHGKSLSEAHAKLKALEKEHLANLKKYGFADESAAIPSDFYRFKKLNRLQRLRKIAMVAFFLGVFYLVVTVTLKTEIENIQTKLKNRMAVIHKRLTLTYLIERELVMIGRWSPQEAVDKGVIYRKALQNLDPIFREYLKGFSKTPLIFDAEAPLKYGEKPKTTQ